MLTANFNIKHLQDFVCPIQDTGCCRIVQSIAGYPALLDIRYIPNSDSNRDGTTTS